MANIDSVRFVARWPLEVLTIEPFGQGFEVVMSTPTGIALLVGTGPAALLANKTPERALSPFEPWTVSAPEVCSPLGELNLRDTLAVSCVVERAALSLGSAECLREEMAEAGFPELFTEQGERAACADEDVTAWCFDVLLKIPERPRAKGDESKRSSC